MSLYTLQKLIREINRDPTTREAFMVSPETVVEGKGLSALESKALVGRDYGALYGFGVHGLLLRPFSILHGVAERDYLKSIRGEA